MRKTIALLALLTVAAAPPSPTSAIDRAVDRWLGPDAVDGWAAIEFLDDHRCAALPKLAAILRVVPQGEFGEWSRRADIPATTRISNALRALRILTAHDEFGPISKADFARLPWRKEIPGGGSVMQPNWLTQDMKRGQSRFFAYWLSHGESYFAPARTQRAIIGQWRRYLRTFDCRARLPDSRKEPTFFNG